MTGENPTSAARNIASGWSGAILFLIFFIASSAYSLYLQRIDKDLKTFAAPLGIVSFELPDDADDSRAIITSWSDDDCRKAQKSLNLDYGFVILYSTTLALAWYLAGPHLQEDCGNWFRVVIRLLIVLMVLAGLLDVVENLILRRMLNDPATIEDSTATLVWWCAGLKFVLIFGLGIPGLILAVTVHEKLQVVYSRTVRPWFEWIARYPLMALVAGAILFVTGVPNPESPGLGISYLFWHDNPDIRTMAGLMLGILIFELGFVGYLLDAEQKWMWKPELTGPRATALRLWNRALYLLAIWVPLLGVIVYRVAQDFEGRGRLLLGLAIGFVGSLIVWGVLYIISRVFFGDKTLIAVRSGVETSARLKHILKLPDDNHLAWMHLSAVWMFVLTLISVVVALSAYHEAAVAICVLLVAVTIVYGRLVYTFPDRHFGWIAAGAAVAIAAAGLASYPHRFEGLDHYYKTQNLVRLSDFDSSFDHENGKPESPPIESGLMDNHVLVRKWRERHPNKKPNLIVVAASGGGIRAAVWTTVVLTHLERKIEGFPYQVRLITGTSGGMLGSAHYVETLKEPGTDRDPTLEELVDNISEEGLSAASWTLVARDIPLLGYGSQDRGKALEQSWRKNTGGSLEEKLSSLAKGEKEGWRPSLVFLPMLVDDGRRLLISNLDLSDLTISSGSVILDNKKKQKEKIQRHAYSWEALQFYHLFPKARDELLLSTAVRMNASFPYISPPGVLPTIPPRRVTDAGFYDNYGVNLAVRWLSNLARIEAEDKKTEVKKTEKKTNWLRDNVSHVVLIQISDHPAGQSRRQLTMGDEEPRKPIVRGQDWLLTPFNAVLSARNSTMSFRNDEQVAELDRLLNTTGKKEFFTTVSFEFTANASLSWYLADSEIARLRYCMEGDEVDPQLYSKLKHTHKLPPKELERVKSGMLQNKLNCCCRS